MTEEIKGKRERQQEPNSDYLIRAITGDRQIRAIAVKTTGLVEEARMIQQTSPLASAALGRTLTGALMVASLLKSGKEISLLFQGDGPLEKIVAEADLNGSVRGYVKNPRANLPMDQEGKLAVSRGIGRGTLIVRKDLGLKEPYEGQVPLVSGEIGEDLTYYFTKSEQTPSSVGVGVLVNTDLSIAAAGGFLIQLFPEAEDDSVSRLEKNIEAIKSVSSLIKQGMSPEDLLSEVLEGLEFRIMESKKVQYSCRCSRERVAALLEGLDPEEIKQTLDEQGKIEVGCHFCNESYEFSAEDIEKLELDSDN